MLLPALANPALIIYKLADHEVTAVASNRYSIEDTHPEFRNGETVWVSDIVPGALIRGEIRGIARRVLVDFWLVDFGAPVSEIYPFPCVSVGHPQILKPGLSKIITSCWGERNIGKFRPGDLCFTRTNENGCHLRISDGVCVSAGPCPHKSSPG